MSYASLLLTFLVLPIVVLSAAVAWRTFRVRQGARPIPRSAGPLLVILIAVSALYTAPWDYWMIDAGIFVYPPSKVAAWVGVIPVEDLLLFALQCVFVGLWAILLATFAGDPPSPVRGGKGIRLGSGGVLAAAVLASLAAESAHALYLKSILIWFGPPLILQLAAGADILVMRWRQWLQAIVPTTLWLWVAEIVAIGQGIWWIDPARSVTARPGGIPLEDLVIFLVGNLFVVQTMLLVTDGTMRSRIRAWANLLRAREPATASVKAVRAVRAKEMP